MEIFNIIHHHKYEANRISLMVSSKKKNKGEKRPKLFKVCCRERCVESEEQSLKENIQGRFSPPHKLEMIVNVRLLVSES